jgi:U3 small nucleolar RNA-associated protein 15
LDVVLKKNNVELTITVIEELIDRNALKLALLNRSEEDLEILLKFVLWKIRDPKTMNIILYVFNMLVDYYMVMFGKNAKIDSLFNKILTTMKEEIELERKLKDIDTQIDTVNNLNNFSYLYD